MLNVVFDKIFNPMWPIFHAVWQLFVVVNGQIWKKYSSHLVTLVWTDLCVLVERSIEREKERERKRLSEVWRRAKGHKMWTVFYLGRQPQSQSGFKGQTFCSMGSKVITEPKHHKDREKASWVSPNVNSKMMKKRRSESEAKRSKKKAF